MKVVNIVQRYAPAVGGSETWCQEVCRYLARTGHDVEVITYNVNKEEEFWREPLDKERTVAFGERYLDQGVLVRRYIRSLPIHTIHHLIYGRLLDQLFKIYFFGPHSAEMYGKMWRSIRKADVVFLHTAPYPHNYFAFLYAKLFRKKTVFVPHFHPKHPHYERWSNYWLMKKCDGVITVSEYEKDYLCSKGITKDKIHVTGNAIHPESYAPLDMNAFRASVTQKYGLHKEQIITFIGRKTKEKGVSHLIEAVKALRKDIPVKLFLVGPTIDWYTDLYESLDPNDRETIIEMGVLSHQEKVNLLHMSDLLVLPSQYEAFGIVFLEAWICGVPVLGTTEGAMPSVIGEDGFLCKFGDAADLKLRLAEALADPELLKSKGAQGKAKVLQEYTWDVIGMKVERALRTAHDS